MSSRGATLFRARVKRTLSACTVAYTLRCVNGALPAEATGLLRSPPQLVGPFYTCACTAFTATGGSLEHRFDVYSSESSLFQEYLIAPID